MKEFDKDIVIRYIKTHNKTRKLYTYKNQECELRNIHKELNGFISKRFVPSIFSKAYVKNSSIYDNALAHMYNDYFIIIDVKDFFRSISHKKLIEKVYKEINLNKKNQIKINECTELIDLCSANKKGLPLGFITSPILSNIFLKEFDCIVYGKLKRLESLSEKNVIYTRYADDITISFKYELEEKSIEIENEVLNIVSFQLRRLGLKINRKKTKSYNLNVSNHVKVTGVNITKTESNYRHLTVGRKTKNQLYYNTIKAYETSDKKLAEQVKGMYSFILSIEKQGFESVYSETMLNIIRQHGFSSLSDMIKQL